MLQALESGPYPVERLVSVTGLSHRSVVSVLRRLGPWLTLDERGYRLQAALPESEEAGPSEAAVVRAISALVEGAPVRRRRLDHVAATPETCLRRAGFLASRYWLKGAHVVFLGDHDLTSLALALLQPSGRLSVVDVDDDLLEYVVRAGSKLGVDVDCWFADLRLGLPPALRESADLVFSDPPYTPEGMRLFAERGCQALRRNERSRLLLCYGFGERQPALGLKVQAVLHQLRLVLVEVQPQFNRYVGAQAIGGASSLYVTRPVRDTWRLVDRGTAAAGRIYSQGPASIESRDRRLPDELRRCIVQPVPVAELWRLCERHATARPERRPALPEVAAVDLTRAPELAPRLLMANRIRCLQLVLPDHEANALLDHAAWQGRFFGAAYDLRHLAGSGGVAAVEVEPHERPLAGAAALARHVIHHPAAAIGSSLREALTRIGRGLTQNQARELVDGYPTIETYREARAVDLPLHALRQVAELLPDLAARAA